MDKKYTPQNIEKDIYENWIKKGYFHAKVVPGKKKFTIIMPPPNITGQLHVGHAFTMTLQDAMTRYKRMQGFETLYVPGSDHAAIATEAKVVESLKAQGITKKDLGREKFLEKVEEWYVTYGDRIFEQTKRLGVSCDWERKAFTMDEPRCKAVKHVFKVLFDEGLIYRGKKIINWCPECKTSLSDIEVEYREHKGKIWHMRYPFKDGSGYIVVATTRPETMFGDVAVAVNPTDEKKSGLIGRTLILPFVNREIPIIGDDYVEKDFGSGFVKITPAHDPNDYEIGLRHNLEVIKVIDDDGKLNNECVGFAGMDRLEAREKVVQELQKMGLIEKIENYDNTNGHCTRCGTLCEPRLSTQWFVKMEELAKPAIDVVKNGEIKFHPKRLEKVYLHWMENIKDWCISRQLWSGHRIPAYQCQDCGEWTAIDDETPYECQHCHGKNLVQDEDALDTWFSSALWPFTTLGYPKNTEDLGYFYPTDLMITGYDIIFFWVARMIFSGLKFTGKVPFKDVLFNGIVRDSLGRKMSKNLGNGVEPISVIDKYGADSLRYALTSGTSVGQDTRYSEDKVVSASNYINKIWNATNFVLANTQNMKSMPLDKCELSIFDKWILNECNDTLKKYVQLMDRFDMGIASQNVYDFAWTKFCDYYIEFAKVLLKSENQNVVNATQNVLVYVLTCILKMMHPITPFATEEMYLALPEHDESIMTSILPKSTKKFSFVDDAKTVSEIIELVKVIRNARSENKISDNKKLKNVVIASQEYYGVLNNSKDVVAKLCLIENVEVKNEYNDENSTTIITKLGKIFINFSENVDATAEIARLRAQIEKQNFEIERSQKMLSNERYVSKAPANLVEAERQKLAKNKEILISLKNELKKFEK